MNKVWARTTRASQSLGEDAPREVRSGAGLAFAVRAPWIVRSSTSATAKSRSSARAEISTPHKGCSIRLEHEAPCRALRRRSRGALFLDRPGQARQGRGKSRSGSDLFVPFGVAREGHIAFRKNYSTLAAPKHLRAAEPTMTGRWPASKEISIGAGTGPLPSGGSAMAWIRPLTRAVPFKLVESPPITRTDPSSLHQPRERLRRPRGFGFRAAREGRLLGNPNCSWLRERYNATPAISTTFGVKVLDSRSGTALSGTSRSRIAAGQAQAGALDRFAYPRHF